MSIVEQIGYLEGLAALDSAIRGLTEQLDKEQSALEGVKGSLRDIDAQLARDRQSVVEMEKTRQELMTELRQHEKLIERSRDRLGRARTERESQAAEREVDELRKLGRDRDEDIRRVVGLIDQARASIVQGEAKQVELRAQLEADPSGASQAGAAIRAELEQKTKERAALAAKLPARILRRYQTVSARRPVALAKTHDGTCLGCHIGLPPAMFHQMLSRTQFEECPHCHRIIWYEPPPAASDAEGEGG
ncbi:MAG: hypothetical protein HY908_25540 [Myxococcales bacterium]|nr:hypothetical protein [Myxococcales bacterium]